MAPQTLATPIRQKTRSQRKVKPDVSITVDPQRALAVTYAIGERNHYEDDSLNDEDKIAIAKLYELAFTRTPGLELSSGTPSGVPGMYVYTCSLGCSHDITQEALDTVFETGLSIANQICGTHDFKFYEMKIFLPETVIDLGDESSLWHKEYHAETVNNSNHVGPVISTGIVAPTSDNLRTTLDVTHPSYYIKDGTVIIDSDHTWLFSYKESITSGRAADANLTISLRNTNSRIPLESLDQAAVLSVDTVATAIWNEYVKIMHSPDLNPSDSSLMNLSEIRNYLIFLTHFISRWNPEYLGIPTHRALLRIHNDSYIDVVS